MKTLVVFFSRKGYVKKLAEEIAWERRADLLELETPEPTKGKLYFWWCGRFGMHRWGMRLSPITADISSYDRVIICSPVWVFSISAPIREFIVEQGSKIKSAEYVLVHFSHPMKYPAAVKWMDEALGRRHESFLSVCCMFGRVRAKKYID